jgi:hypothetical protein
VVYLDQSPHERYATPQTASRPFDRKRSGFVMAEGAGALVLENWNARERERRSGVRFSATALADAYRIMTPIRGEGAASVGATVKDAALGPRISTTSMLTASTAQNDGRNLAIKNVFGERAKSIPVSSTNPCWGTRLPQPSHRNDIDIGGHAARAHSARSTIIPRSQMRPRLCPQCCRSQGIVSRCRIPSASAGRTHACAWAGLIHRHCV